MAAKTATAGTQRAKHSKKQAALSQQQDERGAMKKLGRFLLDNQTRISFNIIGALLLSYISVPATQPFISKFFTPSYHNPRTGKHAIGPDDYYFIVFCVVLLTGLRDSCMRYVLAPLAQRWGVKSAKDATRFAEQGWMLLYYTVAWPTGLYIYMTSPYYLDMKQLWTDWPQREMGLLMKAYMLWQWAFWIQQVVVINIEERRKDHWQMLSHHFVTIGLIAASYHYHQTRVGNLILVVMDIIDLFLPMAKCLKYLGFTTICDVLFAGFIISWTIGRHVLFVMICWSVYYDLPRTMTFACYRGSAEKLQGPLPLPNDWAHLLEPFLDPTGQVCFSQGITNGFLVSLLSLEVMMVIWFTFIVKIVIRVFQGHSAEDLRSDGEDEGDEEIEEPESVDDIDKQEAENQRRPTHNTTTAASGVRIAEKELLHRIGCEKRIN